MKNTAVCRTSCVVSAVVLCATTIAAQPVLDGTDHIDFDRPEAWAMKRSASLTLLTGLGPPIGRPAGSVELGLELIWNPSLSDEERRVGFNGTKLEDLNRLDVIPRPRATIGLGRDVSLDLTYIPPIEVEGVTPNLLSAAVERPVWRPGRWAVGVRAYGQFGTVRGDITCPKHEAAVPPGEPGNEFGCEETSDDEVTLNYLGVGVTGGYWFGDPDGSALNFGVFANHMDLEFQVDALTYGIRDRTLLVTDGWTYSATAGGSFPLGRAIRLAFELFYSPLFVDRPRFDDDGGRDGTQSRNDALFNLRAMFRYTF